jgi:hypothetical protein
VFTARYELNLYIFIIKVHFGLRRIKQVRA